MSVIAHYICRECDTEGSDIESAPETAECWQCGAPATITARVVVEVAAL